MRVKLTESQWTAVDRKWYQILRKAGIDEYSSDAGYIWLGIYKDMEVYATTGKRPTIDWVYPDGK